MDELQITIKGLQDDKVDLQNFIDNFSRHGRSLDDADYLEMISLLENWLQIKQNIECLKELQDTIISNEKQFPKTHPAT